MRRYCFEIGFRLFELFETQRPQTLESGRVQPLSG